MAAALNAVAGAVKSSEARITTFYRTDFREALPAGNSPLSDLLALTSLSEEGGGFLFLKISMYAHIGPCRPGSHKPPHH